MVVSLTDVTSFARRTVEDFRRAHPDAISSALTDELTAAIGRELDSAVRMERRNCAATCYFRADSWQAIADSPDAPEAARTKARLLLDEATWLADQLAMSAAAR